MRQLRILADAEQVGHDAVAAGYAFGHLAEEGEGQVYVDVEWTGICGSELHEWVMGPVTVPQEPHPLTGEQIPLTLGHELCGRVSNPPPGSRFKDGEPVMIDPR